MPALTAPAPTSDRHPGGRVPRRVFGGGGAAVLLAAVSTVTVAAGTGARSGSRSCTVPALPGTVVEVAAVDMAHMNGGMMGSGGMMGGRGYGIGTMRLYATPATVPDGTVSILVRNAGSRTHELIVLPLSSGSSPGARLVGADGRINEAGSLGEASRSCGAGEGNGIRAGSAGWVTLQLVPGRYELACNETNHYASGMWTELTVT